MSGDRLFTHMPLFSNQDKIGSYTNASEFEYGTQTIVIQMDPATSTSLITTDIPAPVGLLVSASINALTGSSGAGTTDLTVSINSVVVSTFSNLSTSPGFRNGTPTSAFASSIGTSAPIAFTFSASETNKFDLILTFVTADPIENRAPGLTVAQSTPGDASKFSHIPLFTTQDHEGSTHRTTELEYGFQTFVVKCPPNSNAGNQDVVPEVRLPPNSFATTLINIIAQNGSSSDATTFILKRQPNTFITSSSANKVFDTDDFKVGINSLNAGSGATIPPDEFNARVLYQYSAVKSNTDMVMEAIITVMTTKPLLGAG